MSETKAVRSPAGKFQNPWPDGEPRGFKEILRWQIDRRKTAIPDPPFGSLPTRTPDIVAPRAARGHRSVTWVGHSTLLIQVGDRNILTDPVWSDRASPFQFAGPRRLMAPAVDFDALPEIDCVMLSHDHYDHLDRRTVRRLARRFPNAAWFCPLGVGRRLAAFGVRSIIARDWWESANVNGVRATAAPARHFSGRTLRDRDTTLWCGWVFETDGFRMYFVGDSALHPAFGEIGERLGAFDVIAMPIGAYDPPGIMRVVHMDPEEAVQAYLAIIDQSPYAPHCVPIHWGTFRLTDEAFDEPPRRFAAAWTNAGLPSEANVTLAHGQTLRL